SMYTVFVFNDTATTEIYTLSLHDALPICGASARRPRPARRLDRVTRPGERRSEDHTSELQSLAYLVCRLLLAKKHPRAAADARANRALRHAAHPLHLRATHIAARSEATRGADAATVAVLARHFG